MMPAQACEDHYWQAIWWPLGWGTPTMTYPTSWTELTVQALASTPAEVPVEPYSESCASEAKARVGDSVY